VLPGGQCKAQSQAKSQYGQPKLVASKSSNHRYYGQTEQGGTPAIEQAQVKERFP
jgi:hypothetical protein